ncbi:MAG: hypothetical protein V1492_03375 [Candidatus Micrarchaeota archaeon]
MNVKQGDKGSDSKVGGKPPEERTPRQRIVEMARLAKLGQEGLLMELVETHTALETLRAAHATISNKQASLRKETGELLVAAKAEIDKLDGVTADIIGAQVAHLQDLHKTQDRVSEVKAANNDTNEKLRNFRDEVAMLQATLARMDARMDKMERSQGDVLNSLQNVRQAIGKLVMQTGENETALDEFANNVTDQLADRPTHKEIRDEATRVAHTLFVGITRFILRRTNSYEDRFKVLEDSAAGATENAATALKKSSVAHEAAVYALDLVVRACQKVGVSIEDIPPLEKIENALKNGDGIARKSDVVDIGMQLSDAVDETFARFAAHNNLALPPDEPEVK